MFTGAMVALITPFRDGEIDFTCDTNADYDHEADFESSAEATINFVRGQLVRSASLGLGRILEVSPARRNPKVLVQFESGVRKTLYLQYAKLENVDPSDY